MLTKCSPILKSVQASVKTVVVADPLLFGGFWTGFRRLTAAHQLVKPDKVKTRRVQENLDGDSARLLLYCLLRPLFSPRLQDLGSLAEAAGCNLPSRRRRCCFTKFLLRPNQSVLLVIHTPAKRSKMIKCLLNLVH